MERKLRTAIIGCGMIANAKHIPSILTYAEKTKTVEIVALCGAPGREASLYKTVERHALYDAALFTDYEKLFAEMDLDAVHVCTQNRLHGPVSIAALNHGIHVLCEKPMATSVEDARRMVDIARSQKLVLTVGYQNRFRPDVIKAKELCDLGVFGEIYYGKALALRRRGVPMWGSFLSRAEQGGGALIDIGSHALDLTLWLMNDYDVQDVTGSLFYKYPEMAQIAQQGREADVSNMDVEDAAAALIKMNNGHVIQLEVSWALNIREELETRTTLYGANAGLDMQNGLWINGVENGIPYERKFDIDTSVRGFYSGVLRETHIAEIETFYKAIAGQGELVVTPEQAMVIVDILSRLST